MEVIINDKAILQQLTVDPERALKYMYDSFYSYICGVVYRMVNDASTAEDIAQEVFFEVWKKKDKIELTTGLKPYLRRAAVNRTLNYIRARKMKFEQESDASEISNHEHSTVEVMAADELQTRINRCIESLPEKCRVVFAMSRFEHMSYQEIAEALDISKKTVENQIAKALKALRMNVLQI